MFFEQKEQKSSENKEDALELAFLKSYIREFLTFKS